ncbi:MAG: hypothetical protein EOM24_05745 [Chloroflexia bacterium]|nr:hypothetical protein [Chloroflexia bacterium]
MNYVIFCQPRTGSQLLAAVLRSHPQLDGDREILNSAYWRHGTRRYLQMRRCINARRVELQALTSNPHISVFYETDMLTDADRNRVCSLIFDALRVEPYLALVTRRQSWNRPYREVVSNFTELENLMQTAQGRALQTEWQLLF